MQANLVHNQVVNSMYLKLKLIMAVYLKSTYTSTQYSSGRPCMDLLLLLYVIQLRFHIECAIVWLMAYVACIEH